MSSLSQGIESRDGSKHGLLDELHRTHSAALRAYFQKRAPAQADADDLVQEVFTRLAARRPGDAIHHAEGYLFQTAANVLRDHARRRAARQGHLQEAFDEQIHGRQEISPERLVQDGEALDRVLAALDQLPERTRAVFVLHRFDGMRYDDIARRLGVSASSVEKHMMKALAHVTRSIDRST